MKKFENILLVSDIDGTIVDSSWKISMENISAVNYFMENGGVFTYATGRQASVAKLIVHQLMPNAPVICFNGAAIYDYSTEKYLWTNPIDDEVSDIIDDIMKKCPEANVEINTTDFIYLLKGSDILLPRYEKLVPFFEVVESKNDVPFPWTKLVLVMQDSYMPTVRSYIESQPYFSKYHFGQSASFLYEILAKGVNKGSALSHLSELLGNINKTIAVGDNENDIQLIEAVDIGFAVADSSSLLLEHCRNTTVARKDHVLADIINRLDKKLI